MLAIFAIGTVRTDGRARRRADGRTEKEIWHENYGYWRSKERYVGLSSCRETKYFVVKKPTAPGIPRRSPIQVLTGLDVA